MKHIKRFESFEYEKINEESSILDLIKVIIIFPFAFIILNLSNPRVVAQHALPLLDVYYNLKSLILTLENVLQNGDVTDTERRKIEKRLEELRRIKEKNPTLDHYKKRLARSVSFFSLRNKNYLKEKIMKYQPRQMGPLEIVNQLKKVYNSIRSNHVKEPIEETL